jgi:hypothetical protein
MKRIECIACGANNGKCWNEYTSIETCCVAGCANDAEFEIPDILCSMHWHAWWGYSLEIGEDDDKA